MAALRSGIDRVDERIVSLLARRARLALKTLAFKAPGRERDAAREKAVLRRVKSLASEKGLEPRLAAKTYRALIAGTVELLRGAKR